MAKVIFAAAKVEPLRGKRRRAAKGWFWNGFGASGGALRARAALRLWGGGKMIWGGERKWLFRRYFYQTLVDKKFL
ncbi:MAG: hypothetical protein HFF11_10525 [Angelakisella sp.]|jgi:hypothetical protein|nr:hypothetical protein [Angelakisella sp.]